MTDPGYRHYVLVVDRSGSMRSVQEEAQNGVREFVKEQAAIPGRATLSLYQFDTTHDTVYDFAPVGAAMDYVLAPRGMTALLDAVGFAITKVGERLAVMAEHERPGKVVVVIATDGLENSSTEHTKATVKAMTTEQQEKYGWKFIYIGANQDAFSEARAMGLPAGSSMGYAGTRGGTRSAYASASASTSRYMSGQAASVDFLETERKAAVEPEDKDEAKHKGGKGAGKGKK